MLKLINGKSTCRENCDLFDDITEQCSIKHNINVDNPFILKSCPYFISKDTFAESKCEKLNSEDDYNNFEITGTIGLSDFSYPFNPDKPSNRNDAIWYVSPCKTYGCWIINHAKRKYIVIPNSKKPEMGGSNKVYKSPFPLHNHNYPLLLASMVAWYIDEEGYGRYVLLISGKISTLTIPNTDNLKNPN